MLGEVAEQATLAASVPGPVRERCRPAGSVAGTSPRRHEVRGGHRHAQLGAEHCDPDRHAPHLARAAKGAPRRDVRSRGAYNEGERGYCTTLVTRIEDMLQSSELACIFQPGSQPPLSAVLGAFLTDD